MGTTHHSPTTDKDRLHSKGETRVRKLAEESLTKHREAAIDKRNLAAHNSVETQSSPGIFSMTMKPINLSHRPRPQHRPSKKRIRRRVHSISSGLLLLSLVWLPLAYPFSCRPSHCIRTPESQMTLFGAKSSFRKRFLLSHTSTNPQDARRTSSEGHLDSDSTVMRASLIRMELEEQRQQQRDRQSQVLDRPEGRDSVSHLDQNLYSTTSSQSSLPEPPVGRHLTKVEAEFRAMFQEFAEYTERDILSLRNPRVRAVFRGVAASAKEPAVFRAFEVLFQDLYPLRVAGRILYKKLQQLIEEGKQERQADIDLLVSRGMEYADVEQARLDFVSVAVEMNGDIYLTREQLVQTGVLSDVATNLLGFETVDMLLDRLQRAKSEDIVSGSDEKKSKQKNKGDQLSFVDLVVGLQSCAEEVCEIESCNPTDVMRQVIYELTEHPPELPPPTSSDLQKQRYNERYDEMVSSFSSWEGMLPPKLDQQEESRRMEIVRGCFVGAKNEYVLNALRIVYVDYAPLRFAGDIIFKLVSAAMKSAVDGEAVKQKRP